jgi:hypothetical protein
VRSSVPFRCSVREWEHLMLRTSAVKIRPKFLKFWDIPPLFNYRNNVGFEVFTAVVMKSIIFWDVTPCSLLMLATCLHAGSCSNYFFDDEDGGDMFLRNVGCISKDYTASHSRRWFSIRKKCTGDKMYISFFLQHLFETFFAPVNTGSFKTKLTISAIYCE